MLAELSALLRSGANILMLRKPLAAANSLGLAVGLVMPWMVAEPDVRPDCAYWCANWLSDKLAAGADAFKLDFNGLSALGDLGVCIA